jgi:RHS repeat-associated protein
VVNNSGQTINAIDYDPFGNIVAIVDPSNGNAVLATAATRFLFTGQEYDRDTGLYYYNRRWYDPKTQAFLSRDPAKEGFNLYEYARNAPTNFTDPSGLLTWVTKSTVVTTSTIVHNWPPGSGGSIPFPPGTLAVTVERVQVSGTCVCNRQLFGVGRWQVRTPITVTAWSEIYVLPSYASPAQAAWVMRAENDHVTDFEAWATGPGFAAASAAEAKLKSQWWFTKEACQKAVAAQTKAALEPSLLKAYRDTVSRHDRTGRHTWGGPHQRP